MVIYKCDKCKARIHELALKRVHVQIISDDTPNYAAGYDLCLECRALFKKNIVKFFNLTKGGLTK